jgi:hypothetical protein
MISSRSNTSGDDWPELCRAFYAHWDTLRGDAVMPTTERFLDNMRAGFVSTLYIADVTSLGSIVRFQGSELERRWGADLTGQEMAAHRPPVLRQQLHNVMNTVAAFPCGYFSISGFLSSLNRPMVVHTLRLPLAVQPGRPYRTVNFTTQYDSLGEQEFAATFETRHSAWFDIGAGTPGQPPLKMGL